MSSSGFFAEIEPDPRLRIAVLGSAWMLTIAGGAAIASMPLTLIPRLLLVLAWASYGVAGIRRHRDAYRRCARLRLKVDGSALLLSDGEWCQARLLPGSMLRDQVGWLYLQPEGGERFGELVRGDRRRNPEWRRLQVLWRHVGGERRSC